jgi:hypothetical protein
MPPHIPNFEIEYLSKFENIVGHDKGIGIAKKKPRVRNICRLPYIRGKI